MINNEIQTRRTFFKTLQKSLPLLGFIPILSISGCVHYTNSVCDGCKSICKGSCSHTCEYNCAVGCTIECHSACTDSCLHSCTGSSSN